MPIARNPRCGHSCCVPLDPVAALTRTCAVDLTLDLAAPRAARTLVALLLRQWGAADDGVLDGASIVVSELVTNALVHCDDSGPITVGLELREAQVLLWVRDSSPAVPAQRRADEQAEDGRGLDIVSQIASHWGIEPQATGKRVFALLPLSPARCA